MQILSNRLIFLIIIGTLIFLIAPVFLLLYIASYNQRKKKHIEEKSLMQQTFASELVKTQLEVQEQTMQTIGADLHDNIGQLLSLTSLTLNSIAVTDADKAQQKIDAALDLNSRCIKELRLLGKLLQGEQLITGGLSAAIEHEIVWIKKAEQFEVNYQAENYCLEEHNADKDLLVFRILQEIVNNIIKHAFATQIKIKLHCRNNRLELQVNDNGVGFSTDVLPGKQEEIAQEKIAEGMGLHNIRKRTELMGGTVEIRSEPGTGTFITLQIPYP